MNEVILSGLGILLALVYALVFRPIDTPPQSYAAPEVRRLNAALPGYVLCIVDLSLIHI